MGTTLQYLYCMTSSNVSNTRNEALGSCLLFLPDNLVEKAVILPCNISDLNDFMCASTNREGQLCGRCREGFAFWIHNVIYSLCGIWNLDFFRTIYKPFCIHPKVSVIQALAMDYLVAAYPLTLVAVTYVLVTLHTRNCWLLTKIWKPFRHIMRPILCNFNIQTSLIDSFATLFLLSSIKFQSVSSDLLLPTRLYDINGNPNSKTYLYLAGDVEYFGSEHLPFAIIALVVLSMCVILPTLLLFLYPCRCCQQLLNRLHCNFHVLRVFMDELLGPYKDGTDNSRDLRYFAGAFSWHE